MINDEIFFMMEEVRKRIGAGGSVKSNWFDK